MSYEPDPPTDTQIESEAEDRWWHEKADTMSDTCQITDSHLRIVVTADVEFPIVSFGERIILRELTAEYADDAKDGTLRMLNISGKGFAYRKNGFEVGRSKRNAWGFKDALPADVLHALNDAAINLAEKVRLV